jgi:hypothetical protein
VKADFKGRSPGQWTSRPWIATLDGTSAPVDRILLNGKQFVLGAMCWPHDCGGNHVVFLIAMDGSEAYGLISSETLKVPEEYWGRPNVEFTKVLREKMKGELLEFDEYFDLYK